MFYKNRTEPIDASELCRNFGLDPRGTEVFRLNPAKQKYSQINAKMMRGSHNLPTEFAVKDSKGNEFTLTYTTAAPSIGENGARVFAREPFVFSDIMEKVDGNTDLEKLILLTLNPLNKNRPHAKKKGKDWVYESVDLGAEARKDKKRFEVKTNALLFLHNHPNMGELRGRAKGMKVLKVDQLSDDELIVKLQMIADADPQKFLNDIESPVVKMRGYIQDAIDKHIVKQSELIAGKKQWQFTRGIYKDVHICWLQPDREPFTQLVEAFQEKPEFLTSAKAEIDLLNGEKLAAKAVQNIDSNLEQSEGTTMIEKGVIVVQGDNYYFPVKDKVLCKTSEDLDAYLKANGVVKGQLRRELESRK